MSVIIAYLIALALISGQIVFMLLMRKNSRFIIKKSLKNNDYFMPSTLLTVPCKGIDIGFEENIKAFYLFEYPDYSINFVVESVDDAAYKVLLELKSEFATVSHAKSVTISVAGVATEGSQKNHNLCYSVAKYGADVDVFAFADSDARPRSNWLNHLVSSLRREETGATSGYRWIVPAKFNFATLILSSANAKVAQFLGKSVFSLAWGGSMAITRSKFYSLGIDQLWEKSVSDDLSLTHAVKKAGYKLRFAPGCLVATYEQTTLPGLFEFARRQFLITRKLALGVWFVGLISNLYSLFGIWGTLFIAIYYLPTSLHISIPFFMVSAVFFMCQLFRVYTRQRIALSILTQHQESLRRSAKFDYMLAAVTSIFMLVFLIYSLFGSTIIWRGRRYKIISVTETKCLD